LYNITGGYYSVAFKYVKIEKIKRNAYILPLCGEMLRLFSPKELVCLFRKGLA